MNAVKSSRTNIKLTAPTDLLALHVCDNDSRRGANSWGTGADGFSPTNFDKVVYNSFHPAQIYYKSSFK